MTRRRPRSRAIGLKIRLTAWYLLLFGVCVLFGNIYLYLELKSVSIEQLDTTLKVTASEILYHSIDAGGDGKNILKDRDFIQYLKHQGFFVRLLASDFRILHQSGDFDALVPRESIGFGYSDLPCGSGFCRVYSQPLASDRGWLQIGKSLDTISRASEGLLVPLVVSSLLVMLLAGFGGIFVIASALRPLDRVIGTAEAIHPDDISRRVRYRGARDEIGRLAIAIDRMLDRLQAAFEREKRFTADVSHELRTPLTAIKGRIGVTLNRARSEDEYAGALRDIEGEVDRLIRLANGLLFLARLEQETLETRAIDLADLLDILVEQLRFSIEERERSIATRIQSPLMVAGHEDYLISLFLNLLDNAIKYTPKGGKIELVALDRGDRVEIAVSNPGAGISAGDIPHLFDRFYRVENARSRQTGGAGLGLAIAREIVRLHGGAIGVKSQPGERTTFTVTLPARRD
ncbi:ATP-binding protein [Pannus brasiliensis CCIBt3594]|uniref:histidine kinase n=1 Tax=Pannus brasiliensis CCIBt3594 TaxID=1427578 RepID=A0AAW9QUJ5_9CHRO